MNKCVFLDRDGVLNEDRVNYAYQLAHFNILEGVPKALKMLKEAGFLLIVVTNQSGIAKGIYTRKEVLACYEYLQSQTGNLIDEHYYAPYHPIYSNSLTRKPDSLMLEKGIAKYHIDTQKSWLVGDSQRDILAAKKLHIPSIQVGQKEKHCEEADFSAQDLYEASLHILSLTNN